MENDACMRKEQAERVLDTNEMTDGSTGLQRDASWYQQRAAEHHCCHLKRLLRPNWVALVLLSSPVELSSGMIDVSELSPTVPLKL